MKSLIGIIIAIFIAGSLKAQGINGFEINSGKLEWVNVYESTITLNEVLDILKENGKISNIEEGEDRIIASISKVEADYKGFGKSEMSTPIYIARNWIEAKLIIEFKEDKYRATLKDIFLSQIYSDPLSQMGEMSTLDSYAISSKSFKSSFTKSSSEILDFTFTKEFYFQKDINKDW
ncbi:hypothetical protein LV84_03472 [Algoriphagus ratkowskyi]|uniref:DUF4468 domain-containing protein n=1 Tax=Algoriphagus ratkowskyi TaxID=57028 RepID=A0A2W7QZL7_9BACT|nr:hypothetical protein [Algoriphagus ratkowskyi]PZX52466.1 hypothetical protein LV84_03472 [Algoriphagus ratkowskyi]TXD76190.1 hypothetical protein ESW18_17315 [Algoriphagus ratkowskyi]